MNAFPLERWAARSPRVRWPLVLVALLVLFGLAGGLTACGGGDPDPEPDQSIGPPDCRNHPELCQ